MSNEPLSLDKADNESFGLDDSQAASGYEDHYQEELNFPMDVHIGFYSNIKEKQVKKHIKSYAEKNFTSLNDVSYQIVPYEDGFLFEIHQGGGELGFLSDYLSNSYVDPLIVTSTNIYRASPSVHGGVRLVRLTDEDVNEVSQNPENFDILEGKDKLKSLKPTAFGFFIFASIVFFLGVASVGVSAGLKYVLLDKTEAVYFTDVNKKYPYQFIPEIQNEMYQMDLSSEFFKNFYFDATRKGEKKWTVEKGSILNVANDDLDTFVQDDEFKEAQQ